MAPPIGSVDGPRGAKHVRRKRTRQSDSTSAADRTEASEGVEAAAPIPPGAPGPQHAAPAVSAQLIGQADSAESAAPAKSAHGAYLKVEWSGGFDRRTRRGRIAKTDV